MSGAWKLVANDLRRRAASGPGTALVVVRSRDAALDAVARELDADGVASTPVRGLIAFPSGFRARIVPIVDRQDVRRLRGVRAAVAYLSSEAAEKGGGELQHALEAACLVDRAEIIRFEEMP